MTKTLVPPVPTAPSRATSVPRVMLYAALVTGVSALVAAGCHGRAAPPQVRPSDDTAPVRVASAVAVAREVPLTLATTGTLVPNEQSEVTPLVAGRVNEVLVERGTRVHAGDPMMRLRDVDFRTQASSATAVLAQARARLGLSEANGRFDPTNAPEVRAAAANRDIAEDALRRAQQLASSGSVSDQEFQRTQSQAVAAREQYTTAVNNVRAAYYGYQQARAGADQANRSLSDSVVRAPFDGEVAERKANVGEYVSTQRSVVTLVSIDPLRIELQIPQERIASVRVGQGVEIHVDAFPDRVFHGTVRYISAAVRSDSRSLVAEAVVPNADGALRPGLFATARLNLGERRQVVSVPPRAVLSDSGNNRVFVIANGRAVERVVSVADRSSTEVLIERGVSPGEHVATEGLDRLTDGTRVQE